LKRVDIGDRRSIYIYIRQDRPRIGNGPAILCELVLFM
jgi:hypothetical protein